VIKAPNSVPRNFPIGRLNNYDKLMKKHKQPLSLMSELESIDESGEFSAHQESSSHDLIMNKDYTPDAN